MVPPESVYLKEVWHKNEEKASIINLLSLENSIFKGTVYA